VFRILDRGIYWFTIKNVFYKDGGDGAEIKKAKGIKSYVVKNHIRYVQYKEALFSKKTFKHEMNTLRSEGHNIFKFKLNKTSLCPLDTKRWIADDGVLTFAYGHVEARALSESVVKQCHEE
jgi:hypothetical protein